MKAKRIYIKKEWMQRLLTNGGVRFFNLPRDLKIHSTWWRPEHQAFECLVESETFDEIDTARNEKIPLLQATSTTNPDGTELVSFTM